MSGRKYYMTVKCPSSQIKGCSPFFRHPLCNLLSKLDWLQGDQVSIVYKYHLNVDGIQSLSELKVSSPQGY